MKTAHKEDFEKWNRNLMMRWWFGLGSVPIFTLFEKCLNKERPFFLQINLKFQCSVMSWMMLLLSLYPIKHFGCCEICTNYLVQTLFLKASNGASSPTENLPEIIGLTSSLIYWINWSAVSKYLIFGWWKCWRRRTFALQNHWDEKYTPIFSPKAGTKILNIEAIFSLQNDPVGLV